MQLRLDTLVQFVKKVGEGRARAFAKVGVHTVQDLLLRPPMRYEDRTRFKLVRDLQQDDTAVIQARVAACGSQTVGPRRMPLFEAVVEDDSGRLPVKFFNSPHLERILKPGMEVVLYGTARFDKYSHSLSLVNPEMEILDDGDQDALHVGRIVPVYRKVGSITPRMQRVIVQRALQRLDESDVLDPLPEEPLRRYGFPSRARAFHQLHFPEPPEGADRARFLQDLNEFATPAQLRFIYEEFFFFQFKLRLMRRERKRKSKGREIRLDDEVRRTLRAILPFHPTGAQKRVLKEIAEDLARPQVMMRLLQGDVGSGKTIVAVQAMAIVMVNGYQTALMAPTEILAEQHYKGIRPLLEGPTDFRCAFLSSNVKGRERRRVLEAVRQGEIDLLIGTHALIQEGVDFRRLGMIVVDEQHRFGVIQRSDLMKKGSRPDVLVMTATPIPRSLALTVYGDLDLSILDELPPGRRPVQTLCASERKRRRIYEGLRRQVDKGRQAYIVYPLVEESEKLDLKAATEMAEHLRKRVFPGLNVGLMHGRLSSQEKDEVMRGFARGEVDILVSTTVIEVGIDVPNASVMVVEHAERFGLSQLHQLRGRIGRGPHDSYCVLLASAKQTEEARQRLEVMRRSNDGFKIAEKDLELRGPGEFVGTRQSGLPEFRLGNIVRDRKWLERARSDVGDFVRRARGQEDLNRLAEAFKDQLDLSRVG